MAGNDYNNIYLQVLSGDKETKRDHGDRSDRRGSDAATPQSIKSLVRATMLCTLTLSRKLSFPQGCVGKNCYCATNLCNKWMKIDPANALTCHEENGSNVTCTGYDVCKFEKKKEGNLVPKGCGTKPPDVKGVRKATLSEFENAGSRYRCGGWAGA